MFLVSVYKNIKFLSRFQCFICDTQFRYIGLHGASGAVVVQLVVKVYVCDQENVFNQMGSFLLNHYVKVNELNLNHVKFLLVQLAQISISIETKNIN